MEHNIISVSGGKDSTALLLLALERVPESSLEAVFADTGHEHPQTYEYIAYLSDQVFPIRVIRADFSADIARKREFVATKWREQGVPEDKVERALAVLLVEEGQPDYIEQNIQAILRRAFPDMTYVEAADDSSMWQALQAHPDIGLVLRKTNLSELAHVQAVGARQRVQPRPVAQQELPGDVVSRGQGLGGRHHLRQQPGLGLDHRAAVTALPQGAGAAMAQVEVADIAATHALHHPCQ